MEKTLLTILMPGIRTYNWEAVYKSAQLSTNIDFEMIFVGPTEPPDTIKPFVKFIKDYGNPSRCAQIALLNSSREYIIWGSDDCLFLENSINRGFDFLRQLPDSEKNVVSFVYTEGCIRYNIDHWFINKGDARSCFIPDDYCVVMNALIKRSYLMELGGWDCRFEGWAIGNVDLGVRIQRDNANVVLCPDRLLICSHTPGMTGDHGPIHVAQTYIDKILYHKIYDNAECINRTKIDINNWKLQPSVWKLRFGDICD